MPENYSHKNLRNASLKGRKLDSANFSGSDLRGADLSDADLTGVDFTNARTGITPLNQAWLFATSFVVSMISGYVAMLAGQTVQKMLGDPDPNVRYAGIVATVLIVAFIVFAHWKGVRSAISDLVIPASICALVLSLVVHLSGTGTGIGLLYLILAFILVIVMYIVGTIARATANSLSLIIFIVVGLAGGMYGRSVGGGVGTIIMALSCGVISQKALKSTKGFEGLRRIYVYITRRFGTSFRNATLKNAKFSGARLHNCDFTGADLSGVVWGKSKKINCIDHE